MFNLEKLVRKHILTLKPYSSARDEYSGNEGIFIDANENPYHSVGNLDFNRYPDPYQKELKKEIAEIKNVAANQIFLGNGSDEIIDYITRTFCEPYQDNILIMPPTFAMYKVNALINTVEVKEAPLDQNFQMDEKKVHELIDENTKVVYVCTPNNPTGNNLAYQAIINILESDYNGIVVIDEAYLEFSGRDSFTSMLDKYPNMIVLQTFSKAWGMAGLRLGMGFASSEIIHMLNKIKPPYNLSQLTQETALKALSQKEQMTKMVEDMIIERKFLEEEFAKLSVVEKIYPSDTNFILVRVSNPNKVFTTLLNKLIIVRNQSHVAQCEGCLRITAGTREENIALIETLQELS
ncbi:histidinol-phosphate transaminase [Sediminitomix flava]|uniref:Histidinol-phosphate aminotransferase n=1 Tax=Sediminitomix flava TaxID=379075 RepID=A0A315Z8S3_SEDFL|nr:histidinol-phosphate transaminase [Sediminitomix flava]PWJ41976.1 histidinol phosphate aminotransferase [Sediminitomix flava]